MAQATSRGASAVRTTTRTAADAGPAGVGHNTLIKVMGGILANIQSVVGQGAAAALYRYAAFEEGKRLAQTQGDGTLEGALRAVDAVLAQDSTATRYDDGGIEIRIQDPVQAGERHALDVIRIGLYEGVLHAVLHTRYNGHLIGPARAGVALLRFERDSLAP